MNQLNSRILEGIVEKEFDLTTNCFPVGRFTIGVTRTFRNRNGECAVETSYFEIECFGPMADVARTLKVGNEVRIVGRLKEERWEDDGRVSSRIYVIAELVEVRKKGGKK